MNSAASKIPSWEQFVEGHLLQDGVISGVCLVSNLGQILYQSGEMAELAETEVNQFLRHFLSTNVDDDEGTLMQRGFCLTLKGASTMFHINRKTKSSVYAIGDGTRMALLLGNLPHGVLLCSYFPTNENTGRAVKRFELACNLLRS